MFLLNSTDPDVLKFVAACSGASVVLTATQINALSEMVLKMKGTGIWAKMRAVYPMIGGASGSHKFNLKNPIDSDAAFRLSFIGSPTHSANGVAWNGTTQYANTFLVPSTTLATNDSHLSYYSRTNSSIAGSDIGLYDGTIGQSFYVGINYSGTQYQGIQSIEYTGPTALGISSQGLYSGSRVNSTQEMHKRAGGAVRTDTVSSNTGALFSASVYLGCIHNRPVSSPESFSDRQCAFASIGLGLTSAQLDSLYTIVQNYQTRLGRQV